VTRRGILAVLGAAALAAAPSEAEPPRRIVSTSPSITETLFALGLGDRVVGVSQYCRHPAAALSLPKVGTFLKPDAEAIARLRPELTLVHAMGDDLPGTLAAVGLRVASVDRGDGLAGVHDSIAAIAEAAGVAERGRALNEDLKRRLAALRAQGEKGPRRRVLLVVGRRPGLLSDLVAVSRRGYLGELLEVSGAVNVLDDASLPQYPRLSLETVLHLRPEVLIDTGDMGDSPAERERNGRANLALWQGNPLVRAAGITRIHAATSDALVVPGPRVVDAAEWLRSVIVDGRVP
jgi:iron complex transport system substrate-binding protein